MSFSPRASVELVSPIADTFPDGANPSGTRLGGLTAQHPDPLMTKLAISVSSSASDKTLQQGSATFSKPISVGSRLNLKLPSSSGLKLKLRCIQTALHEPPLLPIVSRKRTFTQLVTHPEDDTDSEIEMKPSRFLVKKTLKKGKTNASKRRTTKSSGLKNGSDRNGKKPKLNHTTPVESDDAGTEEGVGPRISLVKPVMKRTKRILDPSKPEHAMLIANASKIGSEYYDSDADEMPSKAKDTNKPDLFRNVAWGEYATNYDNEEEFSREPEFAQFVPGRFELLADGTVADQKKKLIIKLRDNAGRKRIFANPPPRDWASQEAITALNKRTVQQIRRNTNVRFRGVVNAYVADERRWILANLANGKPTKGWKSFVEEFNEAFEGKQIPGTAGVRPFRSHSSLTKEVERFAADFYKKGLVPVTASK